MSEQAAVPVVMSHDEHLARVVHEARSFISTVVAATEAGVSNARLLPALMVVMRESGIQVPGLPRF